MDKIDKKVKKNYVISIGVEVYKIIRKNGKFQESVNDVLLRLLKFKNM